MLAGRRLLHTSLHSSRMASKWAPADRIKNAKSSIWVEFTGLAAECKAVNLGQGFPDSPMPAFVAKQMEEISRHPERTDWHQYTRGFGHMRLVQALSKLYGGFYGRQVDPAKEVLVTVGAYLSLYYTFLGWINHGDEVIILEPAYDCYAPQVEMAGGKPVGIPMKLKEGARSSADFQLDLEKIEASCNGKTKMLVINNPHNPTGKLFSRAELEALAAIAKKHDLIVVADEVYEWHVYPGGEMIRFASLPDMWDRTISIGSAGKTFSVTGWKLGWALAPEHLMGPIRMVHQNCVFTCSTPTQEAVARAFEIELPLLAADSKESYLKHGMASELVAKRDKLTALCEKAGLRCIVPESGYFMLADYSKFDGPFREEKPGDDPMDFRFVRWLCREKKLAMIPPSAFYSEQFRRQNENMVRLCFFKDDKTLDAAEDILKKL